MPARLLFATLLLAAPALAGPDPKCGPHQHLVSERDPDEGGTMKRCLCDAGWDADGPAPPCRAKAGAPSPVAPGAPKDPPKVAPTKIKK